MVQYQWPRNEEGETQNTIHMTLHTDYSRSHWPGFCKALEKSIDSSRRTTASVERLLINLNSSKANRKKPDLLADRVEEGVGIEKVAEIHGPVQKVTASDGSFPPRQRSSLTRHSRQPSLGGFWPFPQTRPVTMIQIEHGERVQ